MLYRWKLRRRAADERGASLIEYALLMGLVAVVCIGAVTYFGGSTNAKITDANTAIAGGARDCHATVADENGNPQHIIFNADRTAYVGPLPGTC